MSIGDILDGGEKPPFAEIRKQFLERVAQTPNKELDMWHIQIADDVRHMDRNLDGVLVQEYRDRESDRFEGYRPIGSETEADIVIMLMSAVATLDRGGFVNDLT